MLSVIFRAGYLEALQSVFDIIGTLTSRSVVETGPPSSTAPQPVAMPVSPVKVFAGNKNVYIYIYISDKLTRRSILDCAKASVGVYNGILIIGK